MDTSDLKPDYYPTPAPLVRAGVRQAMERFSRGCGGMSVKTKPLSFLDPGCGPEAAFARYAASMWFGECVGVDIQGRGDFDPEMNVHLGPDGDPPLPPNVYFNTDFIGRNEDMFLAERGDWFKREYYDFIVGNPPFSVAEDFLRTAMELVSPTGVVCFLLRLAFLTSAKRFELLTEFKPAEIHPFVERPSFYSEDGMGKTDGADYAFFIWDGAFVRNMLQGMGVKPTIELLSWR